MARTKNRRPGGNLPALQCLVLAYHGAASFRLALSVIVAVAWLVFGFSAAFDSSLAHHAAQTSTPDGPVRAFGNGFCLVRTGKFCDYENNDIRLFFSQISFASLALIALFFGFWRQFLSAVARALRTFGSGHVIVVGEGLEAETLARNIAHKDARDRRAVVLIRRNVSAAEIEALGAVGVALVAGTATDRSVLHSANVKAAYRVVALSASDAMNLTVAAAAYDLRDKYVPGDVAVRLENFELRRDLSALARFGAAYLFSLSEIAARLLTTSTSLLDDAESRRAPGVHIGLVGWDENAIAIAERVFRTMWSPEFDAPRLTVFTPNASTADAAFRARYPVAFGEAGGPAGSSPVWMADITFVNYDWRFMANPWGPIREAYQYRGVMSSLIVSLPTDDETRQCAIRLENMALENGPQLYVRDDKDGTNRQILNTDVKRRINLFGEQSAVLSPEALVDRSLDEAARRTHDAYVEGCVLRKHEQDYENALHDGYGWLQKLRRSFNPAPKSGTLLELENDYRRVFGENALIKLRADVTAQIISAGAFVPDTPAQRVWETLSEQYVETNRAAADHAIVKMRALGWLPAAKRGILPTVTPDQVSDHYAETEHMRWCADKILSGWRYGPRNDVELTHPDLAAYADFEPARLPDAIRKDRDIWLQAPNIASWIHPALFKPRQNNAAKS